MATSQQPVYFIGIALPRELDRRVAQLKWNLYDHDTDMLKPLLPHITLLNPPSLQGITPDELIPRVREVASRYLPLTITLTEINFFKEFVCYARADSLSLYSLQSALVRLLPPKAQAVQHKHPYLPHVTLAQKYQPRPLDIPTVTAKATVALELPCTFQVEHVSAFMRIYPREYRPESL